MRVEKTNKQTTKQTKNRNKEKRVEKIRIDHYQDSCEVEKEGLKK